jgi:hypothetical protein
MKWKRARWSNGRMFSDLILSLLAMKSREWPKVRRDNRRLLPRTSTQEIAALLWQ